ncbi:mechanosensitive ion channel [Bacteroidales bacterium 6E]|nr:mechanosensitive ion channel [Bacteroidales bacterium 6E]
MKSLTDFLEFEIFHIGDYSLTFATVVSVVIIIVMTHFILWVFKKVFYSQKLIHKIGESNIFSLFQLIKYLAWIISILLVLETLGIKLNVLLAGSAALLVGIGLGLQNIFNNYISGIILLFEGTTKVGDILDIDGTVVKIERIGLRTTSAINRDDISIIIPNSHITSNKVINWSHQSNKTRFRITLGVAYGSDIELVSKTLRESALEHPEIHDKHLINVRFVDFGSSALEFELLFFSDNVFQIENIKSDIRKIINQKFMENNITIPFPQMDVHIKR